MLIGFSLLGGSAIFNDGIREFRLLILISLFHMIGPREQMIEGIDIYS